MVDVSVWITTYNHKHFIADAIESVLMQQTTFTYEVVIGEDCSTDGTREIVLDYQAKYPGKIQLFLPNVNLGMIPMMWASYQRCKGRYVAWLDGDDFWLDPMKLQKQVSFLENNPEFSFCFHRVRVQTKTYSYISKDPLMLNANDVLTVSDFITKRINPVASLSVVHRNIPIDDLPTWVFSLPYPDLGLYFVFCRYGKAKYFRDVMGAYRVHDGGAYSGQSDYYNFTKVITFLKVIKKVEDPKYSNKIDEIIKYFRYELIKITINNNKIIQVSRTIGNKILRKLRYIL
ncbi:glycosyltransferase family 2 protein [Hymenobacter volaticus]|uniref:Glycosyltransferase family 2 protein n=1 Tax=Hymenobacter volaticus TaxID=2932254 RepID=A0ABY4GA05_9BACT|nr:glycosyltransferase family 2 protein [Hymenobacter volaticus]UOQ67735.1 glycosyltransferase family 2 protein [Hymenobacter volaticus]